MTTPCTIPIGRKFQDYAGICATKARELWLAGEIESVIVGGRRMILVQSWLDYVERQRGKDIDVQRNKAGCFSVKNPQKRVADATL